MHHDDMQVNPIGSDFVEGGDLSVPVIAAATFNGLIRAIMHALSGPARQIPARSIWSESPKFARIP
jgi:hypothetical protein